ncbi:Uncharacterised protein [Citrobacter freundii]|nr:Uncharacterised protein [Citrobacter freundii]
MHKVKEFKLIRFFLVLLHLFLSDAYASTQRIVFSANIVASACHVRVDADGIGNNMINFGVYNKSLGTVIPPREFTIRLYESGASIQGCSAFHVAQFASIQFGNTGQLDADGVITRGAGERVRIDVRAVDSQADWLGRLSQSHDIVRYPTDFAARGQFRFTAQPLFLSGVQNGKYEGSLSVIVSYQ